MDGSFHQSGGATDGTVEACGCALDAEGATVVGTFGAVFGIALQAGAYPRSQPRWNDARAASGF